MHDLRVFNQGDKRDFNKGELHEGINSNYVYLYFKRGKEM
jgi:hypothetical protein